MRSTQSPLVTAAEGVQGTAPGRRREESSGSAKFQMTAGNTHKVQLHANDEPGRGSAGIYLKRVKKVLTKLNRKLGPQAAGPVCAFVYIGGNAQLMK